MAKRELPTDSSLLDDLFDVQARLAERIRELEPYAEELSALREQAKRMGIVVSSGSTKKSAGARANGGRRASTTKAKSEVATRRRRRARRSGDTRANQVLKLVDEQPGITITALSEALGVASTGLYRVVSRLEQDGEVRKDGRQLHRVEQATPQATADDAA